MSKFKKLAVCGLAGVMVLGVGASMTACGGGTASPKAYGGWEMPDAVVSTINPTNAITLRVNTMFGYGDPHETAYGQLRNSFDRANAKISIADTSGNPTGTNWQNNLVQDIVAGKAAGGTGVNAWGNAPDVIFFFSGSNTDPIKDSLMTVEEIKAIDSTYGSNLVIKDSNPYSLGIKQGGLAMFYDDAKTNNGATVATWDSLAAIAKGPLTSANRSTLPHYMLAPILADEMGLDAYGVVNGQTVWTDDATNDVANNRISKAKFATAMLNSAKRMRGMGFTNEGGAENGSQFTGGAAAYHVDGNWWAANIDQYKAGGEGSFTAKVKAFPAVKTAEGASTTKVVNFGGSTTGWMITKAAQARGTDHVRAAIDFVKQMSTDWAANAFCVDGGGAPTTGKDLRGANYGMIEMQKVMKAADVNVIALDDRIPAQAKGALLSTWSKDAGFPKLLAQASEPTLAEVNALLASAFYAYYPTEQGGTLVPKA